MGGPYLQNFHNKGLIAKFGQINDLAAAVLCSGGAKSFI
jgi:hypothetical protein